VPVPAPPCDLGHLASLLSLSFPSCGGMTTVSRTLLGMHARRWSEAWRVLSAPCNLACEPHGMQHLCGSRAQCPKRPQHQGSLVSATQEAERTPWQLVYDSAISLRFRIQCVPWKLWKEDTECRRSRQRHRKGEDSHWDHALGLGWNSRKRRARWYILARK
jgi:hypothetical protein